MSCLLALFGAIVVQGNTREIYSCRLGVRKILILKALDAKLINEDFWE
jgi:hypothetical protein